MPISFFRVVVALLLIGQSAYAEEGVGYTLTPDDKALIQRSMQIIQDAKEGKMPLADIPTPSQQTVQQARQLFGKDSPMVLGLPQDSASSQNSKSSSQRVVLPLESKNEVFILVSRSMPDAEMRAALEEAADTGAMVVFRGLNPGESFKSAFIHLRAIGHSMKKAPPVVINPLLFRDYSVDAVPAIVIRDGLNSIWVEGLLNVQWLQDKMDRGDHGFQGIRGQTHLVKENDMIEEMKARIAKLDMKTLKENAYKRFWKAKGRFVVLPQALKNRTRDYDPSVVVTSDITDRSGRVIVKAGSTFNPAAMVALSKTIVVFDATKKSNLSFVDMVVKQKNKEGRGVILISTMLDPDDPWNALSAMRARFHQSVYLLTNEIRDRFGIDAVPTTIASGGKVLKVTEYNVGDGS